jgi:hypothetical protein
MTFLGGGGGVPGISISLVPNVFPSYSHAVLSNGWPLAAAANRLRLRPGFWSAGGCRRLCALPVPTSSYPLVFSYQFLSSVRPTGSYRPATVAAAILACESGGCGCGRDFIRTKTAWLRLDAAGCLNSTVHMRFPPGSQFVPNSTWTLSHMVGPNFHSHVYKLERWAIGEHICFYFVT